ncbi:DUF4283 domain protein [Medicago truncatula]|uniref:DUF4283 domain protein n=1 Tax=Medicago truncatula TaxID=3880 RepID=A0A072UI66_MEDTR|nr:DUF4283 domain protein [Medicago truncatula]
MRDHDGGKRLDREIDVQTDCDFHNGSEGGRSAAGDWIGLGTGLRHEWVSWTAMGIAVVRSGFGFGPERKQPWQRLLEEGEARLGLEGGSNRGREAATFNNPEVRPRRNALGEVYGFVKFSNVRDVDKLLKTINSVWFGNLRVQAKVARFDKAASKEEVNVSGLDVRAKGVRNAEVRLRKKGVSGGGNNFKLIGRESTVAVEGGKKDERVQAESVVKEGGPKEVRVGEVKIRLLVEKEKGGVNAGRKELVGNFGVKSPVCLGQQPSIQKLVRCYRSTEEDLRWSRKGFTASVELIGFSFGVWLMLMLFLFAHFFTDLVPWVKKVMSFQRGAWLRLYGIPLHTWNENFFKLCVLDYGRYLRVDSGSVDRDRFDYARVLVAFSSFEIIQKKESILIDGVTVEVKILEEWGFNIGDDACLYEEREGSHSVQSNQEDLLKGVDLGNDANFFVDNFVDKLQSEEERVAFQEQVCTVGKAESASDAFLGWAESPTRGRASSCPPRLARSVASGPWSLEWLTDQYHSEAGVVSSTRKVGKKSAQSRKAGQSVFPNKKRKLVNGVLRHSVHSLKKVVRLSSRDRAAVLQILKKKSRKLKGSDRLKKAVRSISKDLSEKELSSDSVNKEWNHWVTLHGSEKVFEDDVQGIGAVIGVQLSDKNMFGVLERKGKGKKKKVIAGEGGVTPTFI